MTQSKFQSKNGDTLSYLMIRKSEVDKRLNAVRGKRENLEIVLRSMQAEEQKAATEAFNIQTRLNVWWMEYRERSSNVKNPVDMQKKV